MLLWTWLSKEQRGTEVELAWKDAFSLNVPEIWEHYKQTSIHSSVLKWHITVNNAYSTATTMEKNKEVDKQEECYLV
jgi:hypothetical protein